MKDINTAFHRGELEMLPTPELEKILFEELESDRTDRNSVLQILSILEDRDSTVADHCADVDNAWRDFLAKREVSSPATKEKPTKYSNAYKVLGSIAAVIAIALVLLMTVPQAVGAESIFDIIGRWTQDIFAFFHESEPDVQPRSGHLFQTDNPALQQIYDAVAAQGITQPIVPTWVPDGCKLIELKVLTRDKTGSSGKISAWASGENSFIIMSFEMYNKPFSNSYPKDKVEAEVYEYAGVKHYIISNDETVKAMWSNSNVECFIELSDTDEMLKRIIRSIYE